MTLQTEAWDAMRKPKKVRRAALSKDYTDQTGTLLATLEEISARLTGVVNHNDPLIDQLLSIKQAAWLLRNTAGEASTWLRPGWSRPAACRWRHSRPTQNSSAPSRTPGAASIPRHSA